MIKPGIPALVLTVFLGGCSQQASKGADESNRVGADKDAHGCIGSAGYTWCARTGRCERPWVLAEQQGFVNTAENVETYCGEER